MPEYRPLPPPDFCAGSRHSPVSLLEDKYIYDVDDNGFELTGNSGEIITSAIWPFRKYRKINRDATKRGF